MAVIPAPIEHTWRGNYLQAYLDTASGYLTEVRAYCVTGGCDVSVTVRGMDLGVQFFERGDEGSMVVDLRSFRIAVRQADDGAWELVNPADLFMQARWGTHRARPERGVQRALGRPEPPQQSGRW